MRHARSLIALCGGIALSACAVAAPLTAEERDVIAQTEVSQYMPAGREMRDSIETQELFAQAAFWSHQYDLNPADLEAAIKLAAVVRKLGNPGRAVEITQTSRAIHPRDPYLIAEHAAGLIASERAADAVPTLDEGLALAPQYARLWSLKGAALDQLEDYGNARAHYAQALRITPNDPNILANVGLSHALSGDPATAETWLRRAVAQPGASEAVRQNLELVMQLQGRSGMQAATQRPAPSPSETRAPAPAPRAPSGRVAAPPRAQNPIAGPAYAPGSYPTPAPRMAPAAQSPATQADVLSRIQRGVGPQRATPQPAPSYTQTYEGAAAPAPHVVGPALRPAPSAPQGQPGPYGTPPPGYAPYEAAPPSTRRGAARRRR